MKKLITLTFALLFSAGIAFGQSSATTDQTGDNNQANITQKNGHNDASITQTNNSGQGQKASIGQIYQAGVTSGKNTASITQAGSNNKSIDLRQYGAGNVYTVTQKGTDNKITSLPDQGFFFFGQPVIPSYNAVIKMTQKGDQNIISGVNQLGNGNTFIINQIGDKNKASMGAQINSGSVADGNYMKIDQNGDGNNAGYKYGLYQIGQDNSLTLTQNGGALFGSTINTVGTYSGAVFQVGSDNTITATQDAGSNVITSILQGGTGNVVSIDQGQGANMAAAVQIGTGNHTTITQN
jgi:hypothetical protein